MRKVEKLVRLVIWAKINMIFQWLKARDNNGTN